MSKKFLIILSIFFFALIFCGYFFLNNENLLFSVMLSSKSAKIDRLAFERIVELSKKKDIVQELINNLENGVHRDLTSLYLLTLGIIGDSRALSTFSSLYISCQDKLDDPHCITIQTFSVVGLGLSGSSNYIKFLSKILENYEDHRTTVDIQTFVESIYLMSGEKYSYKNNGEAREFVPWDSLIAARKVIVDSRGRNRTIEEMMILFDAIM
jgi:hypothetical protein